MKSLLNISFSKGYHYEPMAKTSNYMTICSTMRYLVSELYPIVTNIRRIYGEQTNDKLCFIHALRFICKVYDGYEFFDVNNYENDFNFKRLKRKKRK